MQNQFDPGAQELGGSEAHHFKQQVQSGDFSAMRQYLIQTREAQEWQDRYFMLHLVAPFVHRNALEAACNAEVEAAELWLLLGAYFFDQIGKSRGARTAEQTSSEQFEDAHAHTQNMMQCLRRVSMLAPNDPTPRILALRGLIVFGQYEDIVKQEFAEGMEAAPACVPLHYAITNARSKKWGGSHEESLQRARLAMKYAQAGSDMAVCLFLAHFYVWQYAKIFDKNAAQAEQYLKNKGVNQELNQAFDNWVGGTYQPQRSSIPYLHLAAMWYYLNGDTARLQHALTLTANIICDEVWRPLGDPQKHYFQALQKANGQTTTQKSGGWFGWFKR